MPRRKKHSSAFEFTGDEAEAAEQAFRLRHAHHARKPKISVTAISPLSAISKLLHSRSPPTPTPSQPSKHRAHPKSSKKTATSPTTTKRPQNGAQRQKRVRAAEIATPSPSSQATSPARRSHRRRVMSFKLRGSVAAALDSSGDASHPHPAASETLPEAKASSKEANDEDLHDEPFGKSRTDQMKRPRVAGDVDDGDERDMTAVPRVKRQRKDGEADDALGSTALHVTGADGSEACPEQLESIEKDHIPSSAAKQLDLSKSEADSERVQGDTAEGDKGKADVEKAGGGEEQAGDCAMREKEETVGSGPAEKTLPVLNEPDTTEKEIVEQSIETEAPPSSDTKKVVEPTECDEKDRLEDCDPILSEERFQSPVTPQKVDSDVGIGDGPSQDEQNNDALRNDTPKQEQHETKIGETEAQGTVVPDSGPSSVGHEASAAKDVGLDSTAEESQKERDSTRAQTFEGKVEKVPDSSEKNDGLDTMPEANTVLKSEEKKEPTQQDPAKLESEKQEPAKQESPEREPPKREPPKQEPPKQEPPKQEPAEQESGAIAKGSAPRCENEAEPAMQGKEAENSSKRSSITRTLRNVVERLSPVKVPSAVTKRVRFSEPSQPYRSSERKLGFSGIMKMRRRRARKHRALDTDVADVSVAGAGADDSDKKDRHLLLDELQYLLDGIFSKFTNGNKKGQTPDNEVVASSLQALIRLLLKRPAKSAARTEEKQDEDSAVIVQILAEQPDLLKKIVTRFCSALGKSKTADALLALVFVLIFRATPKLTLISEHELDLLLNAFFRSSGSSLKCNERDGQKPVEGKKQTDKEPQARRRGKLGRMLEQKKQKDDSLPQLLELMSASDIMEAGCTAFKTEADAAAHLMGTAISLLLRNESESRMWMRNNRRLDKVVAILYSCEKIMLSQSAKENDPDHEESPVIETGASWIVMEASLRVLEFAVLDPVCQLRLARESRVGSIIIDLLRTIKSIKTGPLESEWMICAALRLCINLCHGCEEASKQLVHSKGHEVVLNCLAKECLAACLLQKDPAIPVPEDVDESFDVRVLCLAVLASTVNQEMSICNSFHDMHAESIKDPERGAISLILEILRTAEFESKKEEGKQNGDEGETVSIRRRKTAKEEEAERERRAQFIMERKITIGYVCLLVGALACDSKPNRERIQGRLPGQSFLGIAAVLAEFLEFHHEVGVISGSMNRMYAEIIKKIVEPEAGKDGAAGVATEPSEKDETMMADDEVESYLIDADEDEDEKLDEGKGEEKGEEKGEDKGEEKGEEKDEEKDDEKGEDRDEEKDKGTGSIVQVELGDGVTEEMFVDSPLGEATEQPL